MMRLMHWRFALLAFMLLVVCSGCTVEKKDGDTSTFTYEFWIPLVMIFGGAAVAVGGFFLRNFWERMGWGMMILGCIGTILVGPGMFLEYATVSPEEFKLRTGFWFYPTSHTVRYDNISGIQVTSEEKRGRRGRKTKSFYLVCGLKSGGQEKIPVGDLMKEGAAERMLQMADSKQIPVNVTDAW
jgi:hypothetical protein